MIICIADNLNQDNSFYWACNYLAEQFQAQVFSVDQIGNPHEWATAVKPQVIVTNAMQILGLSPGWNVVFYATNLAPSSMAIRRQLTLRSGTTDIFAASMGIAKNLFDSCRLKPRIQYPYVPNNQSVDGQYIVFSDSNGSLPDLFDEFPSENFVRYTSHEDFMAASLYIHVPEPYECVPMRLLLAASYGIPTICVQQGPIDEFASKGDTLLPAGTNIKQLSQAVRTAMRDRNNNAKIVKQASQKYNNLDAIVDRVKKFAAQKPVVAPPPPTPALPNKLSERTAQVLARRHTPKSIPVIQNHVPDLPQCVTFTRGSYVVPTHYLVPTPDWFKTTAPTKVSVIVPMFNSAYAISQQIKNWDLFGDVSHETIYVNDGCPQNSAETVIRSWERVRDSSRIAMPNGFTHRVGKIVLLSHNSGFSTACNIGAQYASSEYLLFLNADCIVTPNWIRPMYDLIESDKSIGIVGNMQLKQDGSIDSLGSEWMWDSRSFDHIGRNVYQGKRLRSSMHLTTMPEELMQAQEREMVTGCCFIIRKPLFDEIQGFNIDYRIGYWEDADLNMEVRSRGYKVYCQPNSMIYHTTAHSGASAHPYMLDNTRLFSERWVKNGKIDDLVSARRT